MTASELKAWIDKHGMNQGDFADLMGVTYMAVQHWINGRRALSLTMVRLLRLFDKHPTLMGEFGK